METIGILWFSPIIYLTLKYILKTFFKTSNNFPKGFNSFTLFTKFIKNLGEDKTVILPSLLPLAYP